METTFITIHDLSPEARILYSSDSIVDVLGWSPEDVVNHSCWEFFHPDEVPLAQAKHGEGVACDKAAMLNYCRMKDRDGNYLGCEVVFTVVYDVLVGCTSIYRRGLKSEKRASEAPIVQRLFSTEPRDPRYHMLSHLSSKFAAPTQAQSHEPRAALFLNRFTRTLTIMYATNGLADVLGISGEDLKGLSFYHCIQENCLHDAVHCLENAKSNDSIAYLRFWFRDPRQDNRTLEQRWQDAQNELDGVPSRGRASSASDNGDIRNVNIRSHRRSYVPSRTNPGLERTSQSSVDSQAVTSDDNVEPMDTSGENLAAPIQDPDSRDSSNVSNIYTHEAVFGEHPQQDSSASSVSESPNRQWPLRMEQPLEVEAVVSCTSDGMVVCLRRAKETIPVTAVQQPQQHYNDGLFAVPWASNPIFPTPPQQSQPSAHLANAIPSYAQPWNNRPGAPPTGSDFMNSIRDIAIFAWALVGINGTLAGYSTGQPCGEASPAAGVPVWRPQPSAQAGTASTDIPPQIRQADGDHLRTNGKGTFTQSGSSSWSGGVAR